MTSHKQAREIILSAWLSLPQLGAPTLPQLQLAQAVALGESGYGQGWKNECAQSHNWGATQIGMGTEEKPCPENTCNTKDSYPTATGASVGYVACLKVYPDDLAGAADMIRTLMKPNALEASKSGSADALSRAMYKNRYYLGIGKDEATRIRWYTKRLAEQVASVAKGLGEPDFNLHAASRGGSGGAGGALVGLAALGLGGGALWLLSRRKGG